MLLHDHFHFNLLPKDPPQPPLQNSWHMIQENRDDAEILEPNHLPPTTLVATRIPSLAGGAQVALGTSSQVAIRLLIFFIKDKIR